jgi:uncharacterized surface protein with fasciclin (FAS1) repeats
MVIIELGLLLAAALTMAIALPIHAPTVQRSSRKNNLMELLVGINQHIGEFSTLVMGLSLTGLYGTLESQDYFTLLAPTDAAFAKLGITIENIDTLPIDMLTRLLRHHITSGTHYSGSIMTNSTMKMLDGKPTRVSFIDTDTYVDNARIISMDVDAGNGVLHIVDTVLLP